MMPQHVVALLIASTLVSASSANTVSTLDPNMISFQSGIDLGSSFAGGMTYDKTQNRVFLTGGTYARGFFTPEAWSLDLEGEVNSDCFFVAVQLTNTTEEDPSPAAWKQPTRLGYVQDPEACSTAHYMENSERVFLGGSTSGESMGRFDVEGDQLPDPDDISLFGEVISLSLDHVYNVAPVIPQHYIFGGKGFYQSTVNYPFAVTSRPKLDDDAEDEAIFVASLYSKYFGKQAEDLDDKTHDLTNPYIDGNVWGIVIQKININPSNATTTASILENPTHMERVWSQNMETTDFQKLQATDMVFVNGYLLLAGSTYDFGEQFAGAERKYRTYQDYDGFLLKLDPESGKEAASPDGTEKMHLRIQSDVEADDIIHGICLHPANETGYVPYVYVVGYSAGDMEAHHLEEEPDHEFGGGAFVMQIDLFTMDVVWKSEIHGESLAAMDCAVTEDGEWLYVTGEAGDGKALPGLESKGGDDIWVRRYGALSSEIDWQIQMGSEEDESLAKGGAIVIDSQNNAIIYGNTLGAMGRERDTELELADTTNDIFVMTVNVEGAYLPPNPNPVFQVPRYYFGNGGTRHRPLILGMFFLTVVLFCVLMTIELDWKPVDMNDYKYLFEFPEKTPSYEESRALKKNRRNSVPVDISETEGSEGEDVIAFESGNQYGRRNQSKPFEEEKSEVQFV